MFRSQQGSFAVLFALTLMFILTLFAWVLDTGFFFKEKNRYQACVEAAAMAAVHNVCFLGSRQELEDLVMDVVAGSNLSLTQEEVKIETGYYDAFEEYESFSAYNNFIAQGTLGYPMDETWNAVMVSIEKDLGSLTGFQEAKRVGAAAVAYLPRVSLVARDRDLIFKYRGESKFYSGNLAAGGKIKLMTATVDDSVETSVSGTLPEQKVIDDHLKSVDTLIQQLQRKADRVYTLSDQNKDAFYHFDGKNRCLFDFTYDHAGHEIVFIDVPEDHIIYLNPFPENVHSDFKTVSHGPSGNAMANLTIVAPGDVSINEYGTAVLMGNQEFGQLSIITRGDISLWTEAKNIQGVNFICNNFTMYFDDTGPPFYRDKYMRVVSNLDILFQPGPRRDEPSDFHLSFGPPCPPIAVPTLGILESGG